MHDRSKLLRSTLSLATVLLGMAACNYVLGLQNFTDETGGHCDPAACPTPEGPCQTPACVDGQCATTSIPEGQPAPGAPQEDCQKTLCAGDGGTTPKFEAQGTPCTRDGGAGVCDEQGACVACNLSKDCVSGVCSADHACVECNGAVDCDSGICMTSKCVAANCMDGVKNGDETDKDCGGSCGMCDDGKTCQKPSDCTGGACTAANQCCTPTTCAALGLTCGSAPDGCGGMLDCNDGVKNGTETDVDCGGAACAKCPQGKHCGATSDCTTSPCVDGVCCASTCTQTCYACNVTGKEGTCSPLLMGAADPSAGCSKPTNACDGSGNCRLGTGQSCMMNASCASGSCVLGKCN